MQGSVTEGCQSTSPLVTLWWFDCAFCPSSTTQSISSLPGRVKGVSMASQAPCALQNIPELFLCLIEFCASEAGGDKISYRCRILDVPCVFRVRTVVMSS